MDFSNGKTEDEMTTNKALPFLFGIEIETLITLPPDPSHPVDFTNADALEAVWEHFKNLGLHCLDRKSAEKKTYSKWKTTIDASLYPLQDDALLELEAEFPHCFGPELPRASLWRGRAIELVSRPMAVPLLSSVPHEQPEWAEAKSYYQALTCASTMNNPPFIAHQSKQCALHIHFGLITNEAPPILLLQHLAILSLIYEPVLCSLHPPHRTPYATSQANSFAQSNRIAFRKSNHSCHDNELTATEFRRRVMLCKDIEELAWLMGAGSPLADDLSKLPVSELSEVPQLNDIKPWEDCVGAGDVESRSSSQLVNGSSEHTQDDVNTVKDWGNEPISPSCARWEGPDSLGLAATEVDASAATSKPGVCSSSACDSGYHSSPAPTQPHDETSFTNNTHASTSPQVDASETCSSADTQGSEHEHLGAAHGEPLANQSWGSPDSRDRATLWETPADHEDWDALGADFEYNRALRHGEKYRIVRWNLLPRRGGTHTIEFRQPSGTLDHVEAAYTVQFYTALMRAAERRMLVATAGGSEEEEEDEQHGTLEGLLTLLRLPEEVNAYWRTRAARMAVERETVEQKTGDVVGGCQRCWFETNRRPAVTAPAF